MCDIKVNDNNETMNSVKTVDNRPVSLTDVILPVTIPFKTTNSLKCLYGQQGFYSYGSPKIQV